MLFFLEVCPTTPISSPGTVAIISCLMSYFTMSYYESYLIMISYVQLRKVSWVRLTHEFRGMDINPPWLGNHNGPDPLNNSWFIHHQNRGCCWFFSVSNRDIVNHPKKNGISESPSFFAGFDGKDTWITIIFLWFWWFFVGFSISSGVTRLTQIMMRWPGWPLPCACAPSVASTLCRSAPWRFGSVEENRVWLCSFTIVGWNMD